MAYPTLTKISLCTGSIQGSYQAALHATGIERFMALESAVNARQELLQWPQVTTR